MIHLCKFAFVDISAHTVITNPCISVERTKHDVTNDRAMLLWQDGKITEDEWMGMWEKFALERETSGRLPDWHHNYIDFLFGVSDTSGNQHKQKLAHPA